MNYNILAFAPYKELTKTLQVISKQYDDLNLTIFNADLSEATKILSELNENDYDAILSRGGTADILKKSTKLPVVDISISLYDILSSIKLAQNYTNNFVIIAHKTITEEAHLICDILAYDIEIITIENNVGALEALDEIKFKNYELILCDVITNKIAISKNMRTLLITSGLDSIKKALEESISISKQLCSQKNDLNILKEFTSSLDEKYLCLDENNNSVLSNIDKELSNKIINHINKTSNLDRKFSINSKSDKYNISQKNIIVNDTNYNLLKIYKNKSQIISKKFGISIQSRDEVKKYYYEKLDIPSYISKEMKNQLSNYNNNYSSFIIWGKKGNAKTSVAYHYFLHQLTENKNLVMINASLFNEKTWKYLLNVNYGPILGEQNTIIFKNFEQIKDYDLEKLFNVIHNSNFLVNNKIIFIINNDNLNSNLINKITSELHSGNFYVKSLNERKNELNSIITTLINNVNIESNKNVIGFEPRALNEMINYSWPGNISQLQNILKELVLSSTGHYISYRQVVEILEKQKIIGDINIENYKNIYSIENSKSLTLHEYNKLIINQILEKNNGNKTKTADELGISRTTLWRIINE